MKSHHSFLLLLLVCLLTCGCTPARRLGGMMGKTATAVPLFVAEGLLNGLLDGDLLGSDKTYSEKIAQEECDEAWKGYWRAHPEQNPRMAEAYSKD